MKYKISEIRTAFAIWSCDPGWYRIHSAAEPGPWTPDFPVFTSGELGLYLCASITSSI